VLENKKTSMHVRVMNFQRRIIKIIHCYCIEGCIYNLKRIYSLWYFHQYSTWLKSWIIKKWISKELITPLLHEVVQQYLHYKWFPKLHNILLVCFLSTFLVFHAWFEDLLALYSLHPKLLECFDWNTYIKESVKNLWKRPTRI
jgi:hypothetical protein